MMGDEGKTKASKVVFIPCSDAFKYFNFVGYKQKIVMK